jgi:Uncharacterized conserved protein (COG2071)
VGGRGLLEFAPVRLTLDARDLVVASWPVDPEAVARAVYPGLEPARVGDEHLVSLVGIQFGGGRLDSIRVPSFAQLNARTYVRHEGEPAVFFLRSYVSLAGLGGVLFGAPFRAARIRIRPDRVECPGAGVSLHLRAGGPVEPGELAEHELGLFESAGLRAFRVRRGSADWRTAEPVGDWRADALLSFGFELPGPPRLCCASGAAFELELPPSKVVSRSRR